MGLASSDLHLQGNMWTGSYSVPDVGDCPLTLDNDSLALTEECPAFGLNVHYALTKSG
jgi:hypothetical protein